MCGARDGKIARLQRLHAPESTHLCADCRDRHVDRRAARNDAEAKLTQIQWALDRGHHVWYDEHEIFVVPPHVTETWANGTR